MDFKEKEQKAVKEKNIFKEDGKRYVRRIKKCICMKKQSDTFTLECRIMEHGLRNYFYKAGDLFLGEGSIGEKKLWLCDEALETVTEAVAAFEDIVDKAKGSYSKVYIDKYRFYVYYERIEKERYDFIIEFEGENRIEGHDVFVLQDKTVADLLEEIQFGIMWDYLDTSAWTKEPGSCEEDYFYMAVAGKDEILERLVRLYYREESPEDCRFLSANVFEADILPYLGVEPSYSETEKTHMDKTVPNVTGLSVEQAKAALAELGLQARVYGDGDKITAQLPGSGAVVANGSTILLYAGKEPSGDKETMPYLTNLSYETARDRMAALGLYIKTNSSITDTASQKISGQAVAAGTELDHGTVVEVTLVTTDSGMLGRY